MASGSVPIVSNCTSLPEIVGDAGVTIDPFNVEELAHALVMICRDEAWRDRLREKALRESARFRWERSAQLALGVLERAIA
jgi:glycosyltransferase involved in cell wall biosynthesis